MNNHKMGKLLYLYLYLLSLACFVSCVQKKSYQTTLSTPLKNDTLDKIVQKNVERLLKSTQKQKGASWIFLDIQEGDSLPPEIENTTQITRLNLLIPTELLNKDYDLSHIAQFSSLDTLDLDAYGEFPEAIYDLEHLEILNLMSQMNRMPQGNPRFDKISQLQNLKQFRYIHGGIEVLPEEFGNLKHLEFFEMSHSSLRKLPQTFSKLENLKILDLSYTPINTIDVLDKMPHLDILNLSGSKIPIADIKLLRNKLPHTDIYSGISSLDRDLLVIGNALQRHPSSWYFR